MLPSAVCRSFPPAGGGRRSPSRPPAPEGRASQAAEEEANIIKDVNGNVLNDGDTVTIIKDLKVKGASSALKQGTKVKNIRLLYDVTDGHDIDCKIDGFGAMKLKSEFVKKI